MGTVDAEFRFHSGFRGSALAMANEFSDRSLPRSLRYQPFAVQSPTRCARRAHRVTRGRRVHVDYPIDRSRLQLLLNRGLIDVHDVLLVTGSINAHCAQLFGQFTTRLNGLAIISVCHAGLCTRARNCW